MEKEIKYYRKLGAKLVQARLEMKKEQTEVALHIGKTQSYISKIENGDIKVDLYTLTLIASYYKKPMSFFIGE